MKTFMTLDEWVASYSRGLRDSLRSSFGEGRVHHIEDLMSWTATYADNIFQFVASMPPSAFSYAEEMAKHDEEKKRKASQKDALQRLKDLAEETGEYEQS